MVIDMIYDYLVKHNGKYYNPGEEVPDDEGPLYTSEREVPDKDIVMDTNTAEKPKPSIHRGRPKKSD